MVRSQCIGDTYLRLVSEGGAVDGDGEADEDKEELGLLLD